MQYATRKHRSSIRWLLSIAVAGPALVLFAPVAEAQYRVQQDGSARDANNRVGGDGRNASSPRYGTGVTPDMIIYGNVTNNQYFRGPIAAPDARAFRGATADIVSDRFIRDSSGGFDRTPPSYQFNPAPYYGESRAVNAPAGYVPTKTTTTYNPNLYTPQYSSAANLGSLSTGEGLVPRLGTTINALPTPTSGEQGRSLLTMSPLGGIRQLPVGINDPAFANDIYTIRDGALVPSGQLIDRFRTDGQTIDRIRGELTEPGQEKDDTGRRAPNTPEGAQPLGQPLEAPASLELGAPAESGMPVQSQPLGSSLNTGQSVRRQLVAAGQQSAQLGELERRLRERQGTSLTDLDATRGTGGGSRGAAPKPATPAVTPGDEVPGGVKPGTATPGALPSRGATPGGRNPGAAPGTPAPGTARPATPPGAATPGAVTPRPAPGNDPLMIKSLAAGVSAKSLADVLTRAETLMREGKFAEAQDQYDLAERAAPNNALITLGRSHAELGASSYRSAEQHLRQALSGEPALLLGRYDLQSMIGAERLNILTKDLKDLAANEPREAMAPFLLAYIHYNGGNTAEAAAQLNEVEKRRNGADPLVAKMRELWSLPGGGLNTSDGLNK